mmetsp:Transcript_18074/g.24791  ORF Transcript_18074/g.24791 Transcript_18074/m.24791 type:complete len:264 (+) Transcript_18074:221-1012(+)
MGRIMPADRTVYACVDCAQPAKAMKKAARLFEVIQQGLVEANDIKRTSTVANSKLSSIDLLTSEETSESLSLRFQKRDNVIARSNKPGGEDETDSALDREWKTATISSSSYFNQRNERSKSILLNKVGSPSIGLCGEDSEHSTIQSAEMNVEEIEINKVETPIARPRLKLTSVFGCKENEPLLTNWNGDFKGTLDYIFKTDDLKVDVAAVIPSIRVPMNDSSNSERSGTSHNGFPELTSSQPSDLWPFDHLLIFATLHMDELS